MLAFLVILFYLCSKSDLIVSLRRTIVVDFSDKHVVEQCIIVQTFDCLILKFK